MPRLPSFGSMLTIVTLGACKLTTAEPVSYAELSSAFVDYDAYPHTYYDGHMVYLVQNRWIYRDRGRWVAYREEPDELRRHRLLMLPAH